MKHISDAEIVELRKSRTTISITPEFAWQDGAMDLRDLYEAHLSKMRAERDELVEKAKEAEEYLVMALGSDAFVRTPDPIQRWLLKARALLSKYKTE